MHHRRSNQPIGFVIANSSLNAGPRGDSTLPTIMMSTFYHSVLAGSVRPLTTIGRKPRTPRI